MMLYTSMFKSSKTFSEKNYYSINFRIYETKILKSNLNLQLGKITSCFIPSQALTSFMIKT